MEPPPVTFHHLRSIVYTIANAYTNHSAWYSLPLPVRHPSVVIYPRPTSPTMHLECGMPYPHLTSPHSELYNRSPHFHCIIRVEYPPTNYPPPTQCGEAHSQSLYQSLRTYSLLYTCSAHFHCIIRVETPSTTPPSTNLSCETERKSLFESFSVVFPPAHRTSSIKISVPPSQCTIPIQRVISLASPTTMHSQCPFLPHSAPLLNSFMDCSRLQNAEEDVLAKKSTVLGTLWRNKTEVPSELTEARGREKRMKCVWLMSTMHHDDAVNEDQEGKPDILPSAFLQVGI
ncbi:hypothetical protein T05_1455 [Trichinella murrelli]|uniref:Uncharacterized protein n=1 Tax=Trichinella murrelli TaxID=144512 RepID=A0A0V0U0Q8_9BILA|nr:hypothetical protein T05_1455 [Trichinella murrelli]